MTASVVKQQGGGLFIKYLSVERLSFCECTMILKERQMKL